MMAADIHHRTQDFVKLYKSAVADLKEVLSTTHDVVPLVASGTGAMEAAVSNLFRRGDRVIVLSAGKFGERWVQIVTAFGLQPVVLKAEYGKAVPASEVIRALGEPGIRGVFLQASETSTGVVHDVETIGKAVANTEAILVVDAITGIGTMPLDIHGWGLDVVIGGSQKAFMIPPGLAFLAISPKAWKHAESCDLPHFYFDLKKEAQNAAEGQSSWTPSTALLLSLAAALQFIKSFGMNNLIRNAQLLARATRDAVTELGLRLFAAESPGAAVTAVCAPEGLDSGVIVREFRERFGAIIANGQGSMKGKIFRIAHLGYFDFADLFAVIAELELILAARGFPVRFGAGVAAAQRVYAEAALAVEAVGA
jgi:aspartate aminotransferase-like enzyme